MKRILLLASCFLLTLTCLQAAPLEFVAEIGSVSEVDGETVVSVKVTPTVSIAVRVSGLTEIKDETGLPVPASELSAGQMVRIEALFTDQGILALEIEILGTSNDFEFRGMLEGVGDGQIELLGLVILVPDTADIKDEFGDPLNLTDLQVLDLVKVEGMTVGNDLVAEDIRRLTEDSFARISFLAVIESFPADDQLLVVLDGGVMVLVELTEDTEVRGMLAVGAIVKVIGLINSDLFVTALKVNVVSALFELSPPRLKMGFEETRTVEVILREPLEDDLFLEIQSEDPDIATVSPEDLVIQAGEVSGSFEVTSDSVEGRTTIHVVAPDLEGAAADLRVDVREEGADARELEVKWTPRVIKSNPREVREVSLFLKKGVAPTELTVELSLVDGPEGLVSFPEEVFFPAGQKRIRFNIEVRSLPGRAVIRATLPDDVGADTDDLVVELGRGQTRLKVEWSKSQVKTGPMANVDVKLRLNKPAPAPVTVSVEVRNGDSSVVAAALPSQLTFAQGEQEISLQFATADKEGRVTYRATLPSDFGGGHDDLRIVVRD